MKEDIGFCKQLGVQGVVFGILEKTGNLDLYPIQQLAEYALPLEVTIHKAIDQTPDPVASLKALMQIKYITSVLTSGGDSSAIEGHKILKKMLQTAKGQINIIAAGSITKENLVKVHHLINAREYHGRMIVGNLS
jgi:copper homeostasis protein